jgi:hypothetical protein
MLYQNTSESITSPMKNAMAPLGKNLDSSNRVLPGSSARCDEAGSSFVELSINNALFQAQKYFQHYDGEMTEGPGAYDLDQVRR